MHDTTQRDKGHFAPESNRIHRVTETRHIFGIGRSTYYVLRNEGLIAPPIKNGRRARGHTSENLQSLINGMGA